MKILRLLVILDALAGLGFAQNAREVEIPFYSRIIVRPKATISSAKVDAGDLIEFVVAEPVMIDGDIAISAGASAIGHIEQALPGGYWKAGWLGIALNWVSAVDGSRIPLTFYSFRKAVGHTKPFILGGGSPGGVDLGITWTTVETVNMLLFGLGNRPARLSPSARLTASVQELSVGTLRVSGELPTVAPVQIWLAHVVRIAGSALDPGLFQVLVRKTGEDRADLLFFAGKSVDIRKCAGILSARITPSDGPCLDYFEDSFGQPVGLRRICDPHNCYVLPAGYRVRVGEKKQ